MSDLLKNITKKVSTGISVGNKSGTRLSLANLPLGGILGNSGRTPMQPSVLSGSGNAEKDWRVRLSLPPAATGFYRDSPLMAPLKDTDGIPAPKINYTLGENTKAMIKHGEERAREVLLAAGAEKVLAKNDDKVWWRAGWHQMGTCRMGNDPSNSVVNSWGRSHDVKNLFIVDGSIFVTAGAVNPTSTIQALALYIGDQIKNNIQTLFD